MRNPPVLVQLLGDTHRAEYFEHFHGDTMIGVTVDVYRVGTGGEEVLDVWRSRRSPYKNLATAKRNVKMMMRQYVAQHRAMLRLGAVQ